MNDFLLDIPNACTPGSGLCTGGRPRPEHLAAAAQRGVQVVVNLCPPAEAADYDEAAAVTALGMRYINIPVAGPADLTLENAQRLAAALSGTDEAQRALLHCASGNRAGALLALKARYVDGKSPEEALAIGRAAGLRALDDFVAQLLAA